MRRAVLPLIPLLLLLASCAGGGGTTDSDSAARPDTALSQPDADISDDAARWADSVLRAMPRARRAAQLLLPAVYSHDDPYSLRHARRYVADCGAGGLVLLKGTSAEAMRLVDSLQRDADVPLFIAIDAEWGLGMRLTDAQVYPVNARLGHLTDDRPLYDYGAEVARQCRALGINMVLGPVLDVRPADSDGFIGYRSFSSDSRRVAELGVAYARGLEDGNVISVAKHFPGHGSPGEDSHRAMPVIGKSLHALDTLDLQPFRQYIESGLSAVMVGHLAVPAIDPELRPAAFSPVVITDLLRGELGFRGLVLTDAINMRGAGGRSAADAILAGADIVLAPLHTDAEIASVREQVPDSVIDDRCRRVLFYKYLFARGGAQRRPLSR